MTTRIICAIHDSAIQAYSGNPLSFATQGEALRAFIDAINDNSPTNALYKHPDDYELHQLATWDQQTGDFTNVATVLMRGKDARQLGNKE